MSERDGQGRFLPGVSGNPGGRPGGVVALKRLISERLAECPEGEMATLAEQLANVIVDDALARDGQSRRLVLEYLEGKPRQTVEVSPPTLTPILSGDDATAGVLAALNAAGIVPIIDDLQ